MISNISSQRQQIKLREMSSNQIKNFEDTKTNIREEYLIIFIELLIFIRHMDHTKKAVKNGDYRNLNSIITNDSKRGINSQNNNSNTKTVKKFQESNSNLDDIDQQSNNTAKKFFSKNNALNKQNNNESFNNEEKNTNKNPALNNSNRIAGVYNPDIKKSKNRFDFSNNIQAMKKFESDSENADKSNQLFDHKSIKININSSRIGNDSDSNIQKEYEEKVLKNTFDRDINLDVKKNNDEIGEIDKSKFQSNANGKPTNNNNSKSDNDKPNASTNAHSSRKLIKRKFKVDVSGNLPENSRENNDRKNTRSLKEGLTGGSNNSNTKKFTFNEINEKSRLDNNNITNNNNNMYNRNDKTPTHSPILITNNQNILTNNTNNIEKNFEINFNNINLKSFNLSNNLQGSRCLNNFNPNISSNSGFIDNNFTTNNPNQSIQQSQNLDTYNTNMNSYANGGDSTYNNSQFINYNSTSNKNKSFFNNNNNVIAETKTNMDNNVELKVFQYKQNITNEDNLDSYNKYSLNEPINHDESTRNNNNLSSQKLKLKLPKRNKKGILVRNISNDKSQD